MRLLIVEDNDELAAELVRGLEKRNYAADRVASAADAELMLETSAYEAAVLDLGLPDSDGLEVLRRLRRRRDGLPVLILTARGSVQEKVAGLEAGADDYLTKPFDFDELKARLDVIIRRRAGLAGAFLEMGNVAIDTRSREVRIDGEIAPMSIREAELLELFLHRPGRVIPKRVVEDQLFGMDDCLGSNAVEVYVHRLRKRLEASRANVQVVTVRGVGYLTKVVS